MSVETSRGVMMPAPISLDLRLRIMRAVEQGSSIRGAARRFAVSPSAAIKLMQRVRATGSPAPARYGGHRRPLLAPYQADLERLVEATPDITLATLHGHCAVRLPRRDGDGHQHGAPLRPQPVRRAPPRRRAQGALEDDHLHRRAQAERYRRTAGARRPDYRSGVSRLRGAVPGAGARVR